MWFEELLVLVKVVADLGQVVLARKVDGIVEQDRGEVGILTEHGPGKQRIVVDQVSNSALWNLGDRNVGLSLNDQFVAFFPVPALDRTV